jgi:bifunctional DNA-binding transcriptional regulator/antitoxin component of YhaV-PrlF toxin-antitoxin module
MKNVFSVQVTRGGRITLPQALRERNDWVEGTTLTMIDLGDGFMFLGSQPSHVDEVANALARQWQEAGLSLESMLEALREIRAHKDKEMPNP